MGRASRGDRQRPQGKTQMRELPHSRQNGFTSMKPHIYKLNGLWGVTGCKEAELTDKALNWAIRRNEGKLRVWVDEEPGSNWFVGWGVRRQRPLCRTNTRLLAG